MIDIDNILKTLKAFANERDNLINERDNLINERDNLIKKNSSIRKRLQEAQSYKADSEQLKLLENSICIFAREKLGNMNFWSDKEAIGYILSFTDEAIDQAINESKPTNPQPKCME